MEKIIVQHFGFTSIPQERCCCFCHNPEAEVMLSNSLNNVRLKPKCFLKTSFLTEVNDCILRWKINDSSNGLVDLLETSPVKENLDDVLFDNISLIKEEDDLLTI